MSFATSVSLFHFGYMHVLISVRTSHVVIIATIVGDVESTLVYPNWELRFVMDSLFQVRDVHKAKAGLVRSWYTCTSSTTMYRIAGNENFHRSGDIGESFLRERCMHVQPISRL